ncbi:hypothetical protein DAI22_07g079950 [Oryza sativa Japonica Group]|nr:hypothetical protein DAI22_07g079950 [Oryza sativa Japonica Group]
MGFLPLCLLTGGGAEDARRDLRSGGRGWRGGEAALSYLPRRHGGRARRAACASSPDVAAPSITTASTGGTPSRRAASSATGGLCRRCHRPPSLLWILEMAALPPYRSWLSSWFLTSS